MKIFFTNFFNSKTEFSSVFYKFFFMATSFFCNYKRTDQDDFSNIKFCLSPERMSIFSSHEIQKFNQICDFLISRHDPSIMYDIINLIKNRWAQWIPLFFEKHVFESIQSLLLNINEKDPDFLNITNLWSKFFEGVSIVSIKSQDTSIFCSEPFIKTLFSLILIPIIDSDTIQRVFNIIHNFIIDHSIKPQFVTSLTNNGFIQTIISIPDRLFPQILDKEIISTDIPDSINRLDSILTYLNSVSSDPPPIFYQFSELQNVLYEKICHESVDSELAQKITDILHTLLTTGINPSNLPSEIVQNPISHNFLLIKNDKFQSDSTSPEFLFYIMPNMDFIYFLLSYITDCHERRHHIPNVILLLADIPQWPEQFTESAAFKKLIRTIPSFLESNIFFSISCFLLRLFSEKQELFFDPDFCLIKTVSSIVTDDLPFTARLNGYFLQSQIISINPNPPGDQFFFEKFIDYFSEIIGSFCDLSRISSILDLLHELLESPFAKQVIESTSITEGLQELTDFDDNLIVQKSEDLLQIIHSYLLDSDTK